MRNFWFGLVLGTMIGLALPPILWPDGFQAMISNLQRHYGS